MAMPDFLIIGAAKAGTTAVWQYLRQHPQVYMSPVKHPRFFAFEGETLDFHGPDPRTSGRPWAITDIDSYRALFDGVTGETAIGEASHSYLYIPKAAERIRHHAPDVKMIAILRNPVERAHSHFLNMAREGREPLTDFAQALREEERRVRDNWWPDFHYVQVGHYYPQVKRYFDLFEQDQIRIYLYEDLKNDSLGTMKDIYRFLNIDDAFVPDVRIRYKMSGVPKNKALYSLFMGLESVRPGVERLLPEAWYRRVLRTAIGLKNKNLHRPQLSPEVRECLTELYREDVLRLQDLLNRDLSHWLKIA